VPADRHGGTVVPGDGGLGLLLEVEAVMVGHAAQRQLLLVLRSACHRPGHREDDRAVSAFLRSARRFCSAGTVPRLTRSARSARWWCPKGAAISRSARLEVEPAVVGAGGVRPRCEAAPVAPSAGTATSREGSQVGLVSLPGGTT
jgi:hypothetical protein